MPGDRLRGVAARDGECNNGDGDGAGEWQWEAVANVDVSTLKCYGARPQREADRLASSSGSGQLWSRLSDIRGKRRKRTATPGNNDNAATPPTTVLIRALDETST